MAKGNRTGIVRLATALLIVAASLSARPRFDEALELQRKGRLKEARELLQADAAEFRAAADHRNLARALSMSGRISLSLGDYRSAILDARQAIDVRRGLKDETGIGEDFNTLGLAHQYLGNYPEALQNYRQALQIDQAHGDAEGAVTLLNNIGNIFFFQGHYLDALRSYQEALDRVNAAPREPWNPWRRQLTTANLATLYQRLGREQAALELYRQLAKTPGAMPADEQAQLLLNEGVLYRRMGDPVKALELYRASQALFATSKHRDGEIGALRNTGIALAVDLHDLSGALGAFGAALKLARESSNTRGEVQAGLYRGETLRLLRRLPEAARDSQMALDGAQKAGLAEEQWKALYALGRIAEDEGQAARALDDYSKAIEIIESVRAGLRLSLRSEFLADKRDVYDSLIALRLRESAPSVPEIFRWIERSRARTLRERLGAAPTATDPALEAIQARLAPDTVLLDCWMGSGSSATLWITASGAGVVRHSAPPGQIHDLVGQLDAAVQGTGDAWRGLARALGDQVLAGVPRRAHVIVVPDGPLSLVPFELLVIPGGNALLIERSDVAYLPSAQFVAPPARTMWLLPWRRQLVAFGDPPVSPDDALGGAERWQRLPASAAEVRGIAHLLPGRSEIHLGADARKRYLLDRRLAGVPLLHFSTHAIVDRENPDRSRILLAPDSPAMAYDYIFQEEVFGLDLKGAALVTVSACDTARGKVIRGEGAQAFSRAFLAAGASATVTSLWRVADQPSADFMRQLYYFLAQGQSKAQALRSAKLQFLRSGSLASPRYWAAFVLTGDGWNPCPRAIGWGLMAGVPVALLAVSALLARLLRLPHK